MNGKKVKQNACFLILFSDTFQKDPTSTQFYDVVHSPASVAGKTQGGFLLPKVLLWSPQDEYVSCPIKCAIHSNVVLKPWQWTKNPNRNKDKRPRLIYDLLGNILVQRIYLYQQGRKVHKLFTGFPDLLNSLPERAREVFPVKLYQRSGCPKTNYFLLKELTVVIRL